MGKSKKSLNEAVNKARNSERELQVAKKELSSAQREREQLRSNSKNLDLKLNRYCKGLYVTHLSFLSVGLTMIPMDIQRQSICGDW